MLISDLQKKALTKKLEDLDNIITINKIHKEAYNQIKPKYSTDLYINNNVIDEKDYNTNLEVDKRKYLKEQLMKILKLSDVEIVLNNSFFVDDITNINLFYTKYNSFIKYFNDNFRKVENISSFIEILKDFLNYDKLKYKKKIDDKLDDIYTNSQDIYFNNSRSLQNLENFNKKLIKKYKESDLQISNIENRLTDTNILQAIIEKLNDDINKLKLIKDPLKNLIYKTIINQDYTNLFKEDDKIIYNNKINMIASILYNNDQGNVFLQKDYINKVYKQIQNIKYDKEEKERLIKEEQEYKQKIIDEQNRIQNKPLLKKKQKGRGLNLRQKIDIGEYNAGNNNKKLINRIKHLNKK